MTPNNTPQIFAENPNENLVIPDWVNENYFHRILEKDYPEFQRIIKFAPKAATGPGENYLSIIVRVWIEIELRDLTRLQVSYILKTMLESSEVGGFLSNMEAFPKEKEVYTLIIPQFEKLYAEVGQSVKFGPQCKCVEEPPERITIVMEDLKPRQFKNINRHNGFDLTHMKQVLKKLAQFHAASAVLFERNGPYSELFSKSFFNEKNVELCENIGKQKQQVFLDMLAKWGGCDKYIDLWPNQEKFVAWCVENGSGHPNELLVLNHGDLWSNNIMFNYHDGGDINETYFVDYQLCCWGSPTQDLYYLITNSAGYDIRVKEFDMFIRIYQENLAENLKVLKYGKPIPSLKDMHILMIKYSLWSFFTATTVMPVVLADPVENVNMDDLLNAGEFLKICLMTPRYIKAMKQLLPWWESRGLFQIDVALNKPKSSRNKKSHILVENTNINLKIPTFVNADYFREILQNDYSSFKRIINFTPRAATGPGENYTSIMVRVSIDIELEDTTMTNASYILKTMIEGSETIALLSNMNMFPKEREVYHTILPQFEKLYAAAGKTVHFGPQCKFVEETPERITIIMEDLKLRRFQNIDRRNGFNIAHMEEVLKKLAQFHAASAVHYERSGPYPEYFSQSFFSEDTREFYVSRAEQKRKLYLDLLTKWGDCEEYIDLWPNPEDFLTWFIKNQAGGPNELLVLNHGDCWSNNIMFQYNEDGSIDETYFVDFQLCKWGSPTQDLHYLITSSAGYDIRVREFDKFISIYHENLAEYLKLLKFSKPIPSLKDMHCLMMNYAPWSFFTATSVMAAFLLDPSEDANIDTFMNDPDFLKGSLMNPRYVKAMKQLLPWWKNRGVFQIDV